MSTDDGLRDAMRRFFARRPDPLELDDMTAARLLSGRLDPADAPPAYAGVAQLTAAVAAPGRSDELAGEDAAVAAFRAVRPPADSKPVRSRSLRLAALVGAAVLLLGGVAGAASTGALPDGAQAVAHDTLGAVGVSVPAPSPSPGRAVRAAPRPTSHAASRPARSAPPSRRIAPTRPTPSSPPSTAAGPRRPTDAILLAACHAYFDGRVSAAGGRGAANAYRYLAGRAGGAANIAGYCRGVVNGAGP